MLTINLYSKDEVRAASGDNFAMTRLLLFATIEHQHDIHENTTQKFTEKFTQNNQTWNFST